MAIKYYGEPFLADAAVIVRHLRTPNTFGQAIHTKLQNWQDWQTDHGKMAI